MNTEPLILNNRYRLDQRLGTGGMATVYRAQDLTLERSVAIKILRQEYSDDPAFRDRFHQEAKAAANLSHPNIVTVHDFGLYNKQLFIVMEYVSGADLKTLLRQRNRFTIPEAIDLIVQACAGIGHAHRAGLVHCDVKPQNMLVTPEHRLKVLDFGIARALSTISPDEQSDVVWGSPQYFSPEQAAGGAPSPASDVYSLGIVLYEMITSRLPFIAANAEELARLHREALPPSPSKFNPAIPLALETIILKVLSKEPAARYRTADQLGHVLSHFAQPPSPAPTPSMVTPSFQRVEKLPIAAPPVSHTPPPPASVANKAPARLPKYSKESTPEVVVIQPPARTAGFDWVTWLLALLALIAVGGLIPFWLWVFYVINSPI